MFRIKWILAFMTANLFSIASLLAQTNADTKPDQTLHIDIPVKLDKGNVVFNIDHLSMFGDLPYAIAHLGIVNNDFKDWGVNGQIVAVFHSDAGYVMLDDKAYNENRHITTGNPYKQLILDLMKKGVHVELCGVTAKANNWVNAYLIPGVKVNTNAMVRLIQLQQEGYQVL